MESVLIIHRPIRQTHKKCECTSCQFCEEVKLSKKCGKAYCFCHTCQLATFKESINGPQTCNYPISDYTFAFCYYCSESRTKQINEEKNFTDISNLNLNYPGERRDLLLLRNNRSFSEPWHDHESHFDDSFESKTP